MKTTKSSRQSRKSPTTLANTPGRQAAQKKYNAKPEQKVRRAERNATRRKAIREGKVSKGDGKDMDHRDGNPANRTPGNIRVRSQSANRSDNRR